MRRYVSEPTGASAVAGHRSTTLTRSCIELLQKLKTNIKIIGCGGGGSNTINRISEENIAGAETYAANTDAQHLLAVEGAAQDPSGTQEHPGTRRRGAAAGRRGMRQWRRRRS